MYGTKRATTRRLLVVVVCLSWAGSSAKAVELGDVLAAWKAYNDQIHTIEYRCELIRTDPSRPPDAGRTTRSVVTFSLAGKKVAFRRESEYWREAEKRIGKFHEVSVFDGHKCQNLGTARGGFKLAVEDIAVDEPQGTLALFVENDGFWLLHRPVEHLARSGYALDSARVGRMTEPPSRSGECVEILLDGVPDRSDCRTAVWVDPSKRFLPVYWEEWNAGHRGGGYDYTFAYNAHEKLGWILAGWNLRIQTTGLEISVRVLGCKLNTALSDETFRIDDYPAGTLIERTSFNVDPPKKEFFRKLPNGSLERISYEVFSGRKPYRPETGARFPWFAVLFGLSFIVCALIAAVMRWRRGR